MPDTQVKLARLQYIGFRLSELLMQSQSMSFAVQIIEGKPELIVHKEGTVTITGSDKLEFIAKTTDCEVRIVHDNDDFLIEHIIVHYIHRREGLIY
ncbi:hypothetical protein [Ochrobactrum sp. BTU1]|jgi:hypothetical protein|uniref:hypothetical protein n=1 Tax=Ochrobactrum sp. BTU1 TaxID=2840456 RepID=UPI001C05161F|nr:hypothetical protein KMS41_24920 [Ochrobactrum sp. BTU1]